MENSLGRYCVSLDNSKIYRIVMLDMDTFEVEWVSLDNEDFTTGVTVGLKEYPKVKRDLATKKERQKFIDIKNKSMDVNKDVMKKIAENLQDFEEYMIKKEQRELVLYFIRHGKTMFNTTNRVQGWSDSPLTKTGEKVVRDAGIGLREIEFQGGYSSDSGRAIQTTNLILKENYVTLELEVITDERLREFNFGTYEGDLNHTMWQDIADDQGITLDEFLKNMIPESFANSVAKLDAKNAEQANWQANWLAEDYKTITTRLKASLDDIVDKEIRLEGSGNVLIASHGLSISALLDTLFDDYKAPVDGLENASVCTVKYKNGQYALDKVNDLSYVTNGRRINGKSTSVAEIIKSLKEDS